MMGRAKFLQVGAYNMEGGGVAPSPLYPFLVLIQEGIRDAGQFDRVPDFFVVHLSFSVVSGRGVLHTPHKRPERGGCRTMGRVKFLQVGACNMKGGGVAP